MWCVKKRFVCDCDLNRFENSRRRKVSVRFSQASVLIMHSISNYIICLRNALFQQSGFRNTLYWDHHHHRRCLTIITTNKTTAFTTTACLHVFNLKPLTWPFYVLMNSWETRILFAGFGCGCDWLTVATVTAAVVEETESPCVTRDSLLSSWRQKRGPALTGFGAEVTAWIRPKEQKRWRN